MEIMVGKTKLILTRGDITDQESDAIVNAANSSLMGGGGVDGAIHRKGGPKILEECKYLRKKDWPKGLPTGRAVITCGGNLKARYVIHTVGPIWRGGTMQEPELLAKCYQNSLKLALANDIKTICFPSISTGAYGYPIWKAGKIALSTVKEFIEKNNKLDEVIFVLFSQSDLETYQEVVKEVFA